MCKYIHTHTMYMYTYMCIIETLCCKAEINRTLESSCASLKKYHHWEKKDWYVSLYVKFISKENCYKKHGSLLNSRLAEILKEMHTDVCNLPQNAPRKKIDDWIEGWENG